MATLSHCFKPFCNHLWKRKSLLLAIVIVVSFGLVIIQYRDVTSSPLSSSSSLSSAVLYGPSSVKQMEANMFNLTQNRAVLPKPLHVNSINEIPGAAASEPFSVINIGDGEPSDEVTRTRRNKIREMLKFAWDNYAKYAWGENEFKPLSRRAHHGSIFGREKIGLTIMDGMDTLFIAGLKDEFNAAREWVESSFTLENFGSDLSVFETNIRLVGGMLSCYALTGDKLFLEKADYVAAKLLPAFNTPTEIPYALINLRTNSAKNYFWASSSASILSEIGTLHLEFVYLSELTKKAVYAEKVMKIRDHLDSMEKVNGLYPNYINPKTKKWGHHHISVGALGDSFYEYLLKAWIQSGGEDEKARRMYDEAIDAIQKNLLKTSKGGLSYFAELKYDRIEPKMDHLACFIGGLISLGAQSLAPEEKVKAMKVAEDVTNTCHESYIRTAVGLGPECFRFTADLEATASQSERYYIQRPELIESYFYLWRLTKDPKYREWAWEAAEAFEKHAKVIGGYSGLRNVYELNSQKDDVEQSFLFAETFKYLYLIFSDDNFISLNEWVFNTEAHPLPIKGKNPAYPSQDGSSE